MASGVRRIEAITGKECLADMAKSRELIYGICGQLKTKPSELSDKVRTQLDEIKELKRTIEVFKSKEAAGEVDRFLFAAHNVGGLKVLTTMIAGADANKLRQMGDMLRDKDSAVAAVLASVNGEKVTFLAVCGKDAVAKGVKAGDLVKLVCTACGGSGGGKPDSAMGGGKDATKVDNALALVDEFIASKIG